VQHLGTVSVRAAVTLILHLSREMRKTTGKSEDNVCPSRDSNRSFAKCKPAVLSVTAALEKRVFAQVIKNFVRVFGSRMFVTLFTGAD
jgi:hypothetical protein